MRFGKPRRSSVSGNQLFDPLGGCLAHRTLTDSAALFNLSGNQTQQNVELISRSQPNGLFTCVNTCDQINARSAFVGGKNAGVWEAAHGASKVAP